MKVPSTLESEIAFIHDAKNNAQKQAIFDRMNSGDLRILLGSTDKMGVGTNAQHRLKALIHVDVPWRPVDIEQREGRIIRQGNGNDEVEIYHIIADHGEYRELGAEYWDRKQRGKLARKAVERLERLGYKVTWEDTTPTVSPLPPPTPAPPPQPAEVMVVKRRGRPCKCA